MQKKIIIGTRKSALALWQSTYIAQELRRHYPDWEIVLQEITTQGDRILDMPLAQIGGKGLFTRELEKELLDGTIDLAVHSLKDMPTTLPDGLTVAAVTKRFAAEDAFVSTRYPSFSSLPTGAILGTSSLRRKAQLLARRPDLQIVDLRGNVDTRLKKLTTENLDGIILAVAGLTRLGQTDRITEILPLEVCLPAAGQGALALEVKAATPLCEKLRRLNDPATQWTTGAERALLSCLGGGCQVPVGAYGQLHNGVLELEGVIAAPDGTTCLRAKLTGSPTAYQAVGRQLAQQLLAAGGQAILASILKEQA